jgi:hypothetical protein
MVGAADVNPSRRIDRTGYAGRIIHLGVGRIGGEQGQAGEDERKASHDWGSCVWWRSNVPFAEYLPPERAI